MSSVTEASTSALGKQGEIGRQIDRLRSIQVALGKESVRMGVAPGFGLKAETVSEGSLGIYCHRDGAGVPVVSLCVSKGIVGLEGLVNYS
jgi:hypothetical protein